ncbi:MAG TPA: quinoprotein dehydrogenase-associated putative ABC transporter substrate-binding protein [Burkholderiaceae bacterium]|nr:quinoprotein dehydrogenase-associated putative ABC transporter substrate-binding protein [Burkholderiaceae bacterium]
MTRFRPRSWIAAAALALVGGASADTPPAGDNVLRVCADPNNMPLSNRNGEGYENRIAELLARDLGGWKVEYTWFPQRMGFIRNTLRARDPDLDRFKCDLVIGVPVGYELTLTTPAYYHSTWAMVIPKGKGLDDIRTPDDLLKVDPAKLKKLRFGLVARTPPTDWLLKNNLFDQSEAIPPQSGDPEAYPGELIDKELAAGHIDVAFAWGPIAGYFAKHATPPGMLVAPFPPSRDIQFDFKIAMGVRFGEKAWRDRIAGLIARDQKEIDAILLSYGVPLLDDQGNLIQVAN